MINLKDIHKRFNPGTINEIYALKGVSLEIQEGEFATVIGTNGSGKSTLLNAVAGAILPESGKKAPATAFNSVDLPEPFVPIRVTNSPS